MIFCTRPSFSRSHWRTYFLFHFRGWGQVDWKFFPRHQIFTPPPYLENLISSGTGLSVNLPPLALQVRRIVDGSVVQCIEVITQKKIQFNAPPAKYKYFNFCVLRCTVRRVAAWVSKRSCIANVSVCHEWMNDECCFEEIP